MTRHRLKQEESLMKQETSLPGDVSAAVVSSGDSVAAAADTRPAAIQPSEEEDSCKCCMCCMVCDMHVLMLSYLMLI